jgi:hypothetical protein
MATITAPGGSVARNTVQTIPWASITRPVHVGERSDWFGLYLTTALDAEPTAWQFTDGTAAGSGALYIPDGIPLLTYELRLFSGHTQAKIATSASFTMTAGTPTTLTVPASASANDTITATWAAIADPQPTDYIELREASLQTVASAPVLTGGLAAGSAPLYIPNATADGTYRGYLWRAAVPEYGLPATALALSGTMVVARTAVATIASPGDQLAGTLVAAQWANIVSPAPSVQDWVGALRPRRAGVRAPRLPLPDGGASGSLPFVIPGYLPTASYELRLYSGADQSLLATSDPFTVTAAP